MRLGGDVVREGGKSPSPGGGEVGRESGELLRRAGAGFSGFHFECLDDDESDESTSTCPPSTCRVPIAAHQRDAAESQNRVPRQPGEAAPLSFRLPFEP